MKQLRTMDITPSLDHLSSAGQHWGRGHLPRLALIAWIVITVLAVGRAVLISHPRHCGCYHTYVEASRAWIEGQDLYSSRPELDVYRYSPLFPVLNAPLAALPDMLGSAVLRAINLAVFLVGFWWWSIAAAPTVLTFRERAALFLLAAPLAARALIDVQVSGAIIGLLLFAVVAFVKEKPGWAAACVALASLIKVYVISFALVLVLLYPRRFLGRFVAAVAIGLALPFAFQHPDYVLRQYDLWIRWGLKDRPSGDHQDLQFLLAVVDLHPRQSIYLAIQLAGGAAIALFCLAERLARCPTARVLSTALGLTCGWMLLLGPATEVCTYIILVPAMAWVVVEASLKRRSYWQQGLAVSGVVLFMLGQIALWFPFGGNVGNLGVFPLSALLTVAAILAEEYHQLHEARYGGCFANASPLITNR